MAYSVLYDDSRRVNFLENDSGGCTISRVYLYPDASLIETGTKFLMFNRSGTGSFKQKYPGMAGTWDIDDMLWLYSRLGAPMEELKEIDSLCAEMAGAGVLGGHNHRG